MNEINTPSPSLPAIGLFRRLMAICYDIFLLMAIIFLATAIVNAVNGGEAIDHSPAYRIFLSLYLGIIIFFYFGWFWTHGGQTLGMKTWRIQLINNQTKVISWRQVAIREITASLSWALFGLGFIWSIFDKQKRSWHDMTSNTTLIDLRDAEK